jgi:DNA-binding NarL/FixJ family response regulator
MVSEECKSKSELLQELEDLRRRLAEFEQGSRNTKQEGDLLDERQSKHDIPRVVRPLTRTEMKVLRLILNGKSNKEIASFLHRSVRTIEVHRSHIMRKFDVDNLIDLIKKAAAMGLIHLPESTYHRG